MKNLLTLFSIALFGTHLNAQLEYIGGSFSTDAIKVIDQDTIYAGNFRSFNNGNSWVEIFNGNGNLDNYFDGSLGLIERNDTLFRTTDSGENWSQVSVVPDLIKIEYSSNKDILYGYANDFGERNKLIKSIDGGSTWESLDLPFYEIGGDSIYASSMHIVSENVVYYLMRNASPPYRLFKTFDGGDSWETVTTSFFGPFEAAMDFPTETLGFVTAGEKIYRTADGGITWTNQSFCPLFTAIDFVSPTVGFASGSWYWTCSDKAYKTIDGGLNWNVLELCNPCADTIHLSGGFDASNPDYAFATSAICPGVFRYVGLDCDLLSTIEIELISIQVFPNPTSATTTINFNQEITSPHTLHVYDLLGKLIYSETMIQGTSHEIASDRFGKGSYILTVSTQGGEIIFTSKLLVQ